MSDETDSPLTRKQEHEEEVLTKALVIEVENFSKKFKSSHSRKVGPFLLRKNVSVDEFKLALFLFSNKLPSR